MKEYLKDFIDIKHWISFHYQIKEILSCNPNNVLIIGKGLGVVDNYLDRCGIEVTSVDIDKKFNPDILCDIRRISELKLNKMEVVLCAEVLEHIPFKDFEYCVKEIFNLTGKFAFITLPRNCKTLSYNLNKIKNIIINFDFYINCRKELSCKEHFWEIGSSKDTSYDSIKNIFNKYFTIEYDFQYPYFPYIHMFKLKK